MLTAQVVDRSQQIMELLNRKLLALTNRACFELADAYKVGLQERDAPPHSEKGEIPHAYFGWKPGGFGPVYEDKGPNNRPPFFASFQTDHLATYIEGSAEEVFGEIEGYVGFAPSHVVTREQNYLLYHDQRFRPWVDELYLRNKVQIVEYAIESFREAD